MPTIFSGKITSSFAFLLVGALQNRKTNRNERVINASLFSLLISFYNPGLRGFKRTDNFP